MNAVPLCKYASSKIISRFSLSVSAALPTKLAPEDKANNTGFTGFSIDPQGDVAVILPFSEVGENCPLVNPYI